MLFIFNEHISEILAPVANSNSIIAVLRTETSFLVSGSSSQYILIRGG